MVSGSPELAQLPLALRVRIRSPDRTTFIRRYSRFVKEDRIFIVTGVSRALGSRVHFRLELQGGELMIEGDGSITRVRPDIGDSSRPPGLELQFVPSNPRSRAVVVEMLANRESAHPHTSPFPAPLPPPPTPIDSAPALVAPLPLSNSEPLTHESTLSARSHETQDRTLPSAAPVPLPRLESRSQPTAVDSTSPEIELPTLDLTPLPAPHPASQESGMFNAAALLQYEGEQSPPRDEITAVFSHVEGAPTFAENWQGDGAPPSSVPANPFMAVSDGAIEYFVEWSVEQSTTSDQLLIAARDEPAAVAEARPPVRRSLGVGLAGLLLGLGLGVPFGWLSGRSYLRVAAPSSLTPTRTSPPAPPHSPAVTAPVTVPALPKSSPTARPPDARPAPTVPAKAEVDKELPSPSPVAALSAPAGHGRVTPLKIRSTPDGAEVTIRGSALRGEAKHQTPVDLELPSDHHYTIQVTWPGHKVWQKRIHLKHAVIELTATQEDTAAHAP